MANAITKTDVYSMVTDRIIEQMQNGIIPWHKPWCGISAGAVSYATGKPYSLLNQILLGKPGEWLTFKQIMDAKGRVKRGEKSSFVCFFKQMSYTEVVKDENGEEEKKSHTFPMLRYYNVFHISQCEGIESKIKDDETPELQPCERAEQVVDGYYKRENCKLIKMESDSAFYSPDRDCVVVPLMEQFSVADEYYSTLFHETTHSTGAEKRLNRDFSGGFGSDPYAKEELVAELGAAFLCNRCGLDSDKAFKNNTAYIQNWVRRFREDKKMIVSAASKAEKAVKFILNGKDDE